jgi:5'-3' exonuclease
MNASSKESLLHNVRKAKAKKAVDYLLLDAASIAYVHFFSTRPGFVREGVPENAILGFYSTAQKLIERFKPIRVVVLFDGMKLARAELYPGFQSRWNGFKTDLKRQVRLIAPLSLKLGWQVCISDRHEAVDLAASALRQCRTDKKSMVFVTQDKRGLMLLDPNVGVVMCSHPIWDLVNHVDVLEEFGVLPSKVGDVIALSGGCNAPGIFRLGRKTAANLVNSFGSAALLYENLDKVPPGMREKLNTGKAAFNVGCALSRLDADAPISLERIGQERARFNREGVVEFCSTQKLERLLRKIDADYPLDFFAELFQTT